MSYYKPLASQTALNASGIGAPTTLHTLTVTSGATLSNELVHLQGHSIVGVIFDSVGNSGTLTANVGVLNENPASEPRGPQAEGTFSVTMADNTSPSVAPSDGLVGWELVEFSVDVDPAENITFYVITKAL